LTWEFGGFLKDWVCKFKDSLENPGEKATATDQSLHPSDFAPAFGRAVAASRLPFFSTAEQAAEK
jgi:hypothetical protein